jgi:hypothetical protein
MATKQATIIIDVDDKSLVELNDEIKSLETSMQKLKVGTQEWMKANQQLGTLKTQFANATTAAQNMQKVVEKVSGAEQLRSVAKLGTGMVGAFGAVSNSLTLISGNKAFDEIAAKATNFLAIMGGLNQITETFSAQNLKGLKNVGQGFGTLVRSVKTASLGMKTALISTGIGALVVGVGLLIANFDKITGKYKQAAKIADDQYKLSEETVKSQEALVATQQKGLELAKMTKTDAKDTFALKAETAKLAEEELTLANQRIIAQRDYTTKLKADLLAAKDSEQAALQIQINASEEKEKQLDYEAKIAAIKKVQADNDQHTAVAMDKLNNALEETEIRLIRVNKERYKEQKTFEANLQNLNEQIKIIKATTTYDMSARAENEKKLKILAAQKEVLIAQEDTRKKQLAIDIQAISVDNARAKVAGEYNQSIQESNKLIQEILDAAQQQNYVYEKRVRLTELVNKGLEEGKKVQDDIVNFDIRRNKIIEDRTSNLLPSEQKVTKEMFLMISRYINTYKDFGKLQIDTFDKTGAAIKVTVNSVEDFGKALDGLYLSTRKDLETQAGLTKNYEDRSRIGKETLDRATQELIMVKVNASITKQTLEEQRLSLVKQRIVTDDLLEANIKMKAILAQQFAPINDRLKKLKEEEEVLKKSGANEEERYAKLEEINKLQSDLNGLTDEYNNTNADINTGLQQQAETSQKINDIDYQITENVNATGVAQERIGVELENQLTLTQKLQDFTKKYAEEIDVSRQVIGQTFELMATLQDNRAKKMQKDIDSAQKQLDDIMEQESDRKDRLLEYEKLLEDANGERYDEILAKINEEKAAHVEAQKQYDAEEQKRLDAVAARNKAEKKAAQWRKAAAIIDAIIAGALAVVKALPNVFKAVAVGILSAAAVGTIIAQKIPEPPAEEATKPLPKMAKGGVSPGGLTMVGEEGLELADLSPGTRVYNHADSMRMLASGVDLRGGMASGGVVPATSTGSQSFIDYDRLIQGIASANRLLPAPVVQVQKITTAQNEVSMTKQLAGFSRS